MERGNNFQFVRLAAATLVLFSHSFPLTGGTAPEWLGLPLGAFAVRIFFVVSGYLICRSWNSDPDAARYVARRSLRIFPGLAMVVAMTVFLVGPLATTATWEDYFTSGTTYGYLTNLALAMKFYLPHVFETNTYSNSLNNSLWTLPAEFLMYLLLPIYASRSCRACRLALFPAFLAAIFGLALYFTLVAPNANEPMFDSVSLPQLTRWSTCFLGGAAIAFWRQESRLRLEVAVVMIGSIGCMSAWPQTQGAVVLFAMPYIVLAFCLSAERGIVGLKRGADISYGVYLYGFPIQQTIVALSGNRISALWLFAACVPPTYLAGALSWRFIERPALSLKPRRALPAAPFPAIARPGRETAAGN